MLTCLALRPGHESQATLKAVLHTHTYDHIFVHITINKQCPAPPLMGRKILRTRAADLRTHLLTAKELLLLLCVQQEWQPSQER